MKKQKAKFLKNKYLKNNIMKQVDTIKFTYNYTRAILTMLLVLMPLIVNSQSFLDKYTDKDDVTSIIVNKKMFDLMSKVKMEGTDAETQKYLKLIKKLDDLKVFMTGNQKTTSDMRLNVEKYIKTNILEELMQVNDNGKNVKIYVKSGSSDTMVKELLMLIEDGNVKSNGTVLMSLTGDFDINEISTLTNKMNIPGGDILKKVDKK
jgi:hypothetical protein